MNLKNVIDILTEFGLEFLNLITWIDLWHTFWSSENKSDEFCWFSEEVVYAWGFEIHFCFLLVEEDVSGALDIVISITYFGNHEIEQDDSHRENIDKPEWPNDTNRQRTEYLIPIQVLVTPTIELNSWYISDRVSENFNELPKDGMHMLILVTLRLIFHDKVNHAKNIHIEHKNGHERV